MLQSCIDPGTRVERSFSLDRAAVDTAARTVSLAFASEEPYDRYWGREILDVQPSAIRMGRIGSGRAPLLVDHDTRDLVGVVESVQIGTDKVARAVVRFGSSARAEEILQDVQSGIRANVSVGYMIHKATLVETSDEGPDTYRVTDWEPYEVSIVGVPADPTVGIGRADAAPTIRRPAPAAVAAISTPEPQTMTTTHEPGAPALNTSADAAAERAAERKRTTEALAIGEQFAKYGGKELALRAIESGESLDSLRNKIMNAMTAAQTTPVADLGMEPREAQKYSIVRAIRAMVDRDWSQAGLERAASKTICDRLGIDSAINGGFYMPSDVQIAKRDLTVGTSSAGGYLVATNNISFIEMLRARARLMALGATTLSGLVGNVTVPKQTAGATGYWLANEATAITESQQTLGQLALTPKTVGAYTEMSRLLIMQSSPSVENMVLNDLARVIALAVDLAGFEGSGASGQPTGIANTALIGSVTGTSLAWAGVLEFQTDVAGGNALTDSCAYATTPAVAALMMQRARFSSTDTPLWRGSVLDGEMGGFRATSSTQLTAASMIFGDFSQVVVGEWGMLEIAANPYAAFTTAVTGIRAMQSLDIGVRQSAAFSRATSIT